MFVKLPKEKKIELKKSWFIISGFGGAIFSCVYAGLTQEFLKSGLLFIPIFILIFCTIIIMQITSIISYRIVSQLLIILFVFSLFVCAAMWGCRGRIHEIRFVRGGILCAVSVFLTLCLFWNVLKEYRFKNSKDFVGRVRNKIIVKKYILGVLLMSFVVRLQDLSLMQRWDAGEYYYRLGTACSNFDFSITSYIENFQLCGHPTLGYCLFYAIGEFFFPRKIVGVTSVNFILTLIAIYCVYEIFKSMLKDVSELKCAVYSLVISIIPIFLGLSSYTNIDYSMAIFFIFFLLSIIKKRNILVMFFTIIVMQTKETGLIMIAGSGVGLGIYYLLTLEGNFVSRFRKTMLQRDVLAMLTAIVFQGAYMLLIGGVSSWRQSSNAETNFRLANSDIDNNCFGIQLSHIIPELQEIFLINFQWIILFLLIISLLILILKKKRVRDSFNINTCFCVMLFSCVAFIVFSMIFIASELARYKIVIHILLCIITLLAFDAAIHGLAKKIIVAILISCFLVQTYLTVDPITKGYFPQLETNSVKMAFVGGGRKQPMYLGDALANNHQYTFIDKAFNYILEDVNYNSQMDIIFFGDTAGMHLGGNGEVYPVYWDNTRKARVMYSNENTLALTSISGENLEKNIFSLKDRAVCIFLPHYNVNEAEARMILENYYKVEEKTYTSVEAKVNYFFLELK